MEQCEILYRTLRCNPSFGSWVKVLHLLRRRERASMDPLVFPPPAPAPIDVLLLQPSVDIFKACGLVQEVDIIMAQASISYYLQLDAILTQVVSPSVVDWSFL